MRHRVLVVDDEPIIRRVLLRELRAGFEVVTARDGEEALLLFAEQQPSAVVADRRLGGELDGIAVLRAVRDFAPMCVRVLISGCVDDVTVSQAVGEAVVHAFVPKPWERGQVRAVLEKALGVRPGPSVLDGHAMNGDG
jgi:response regulator RpfG family c-di-GMP phosphodiesterase